MNVLKFITFNILTFVCYTLCAVFALVLGVLSLFSYKASAAIVALVKDKLMQFQKKMKENEDG